MVTKVTKGYGNGLNRTTPMHLLQFCYAAVFSAQNSGIIGSGSANNREYSAMSKVQQILQFWFGPENSPEYGQFRPWWFDSSPQVDAKLNELFAADYEFAAAGYLEGWQGWNQSCLALVLLLDQIPRNLFRDTPKAFATDEMALAIAKQAIKSQIDREFPSLQRWFFYLPFQHSELIADQEQSLELFGSLPDHPANPQALASAQLHHELIARFGRFPHRNIILDRPSTPAELAYLQQTDAFFG
jgi:uncharacterized protein (DUF924 family)